MTRRADAVGLDGEPQQERNGAMDAGQEEERPEAKAKNGGTAAVREVRFVCHVGLASDKLESSNNKIFRGNISNYRFALDSIAKPTCTPTIW